MSQYGIVYQGVSHEKASTSKCSAFYGSCDFTSASLHRNRVPPSVGSELPFLKYLSLPVFKFRFIISTNVQVFLAYFLCKVLLSRLCLLYQYFFDAVEVCFAYYKGTHQN